MYVLVSEYEVFVRIGVFCLVYIVYTGYLHVKLLGFELYSMRVTGQIAEHLLAHTESHEVIVPHQVVLVHVYICNEDEIVLDRSGEYVRMVAEFRQCERKGHVAEHMHYILSDYANYVVSFNNRLYNALGEFSPLKSVPCKYLVVNIIYICIHIVRYCDVHVLLYLKESPYLGLRSIKQKRNPIHLERLGH